MDSPAPAYGQLDLCVQFAAPNQRYNVNSEDRAKVVGYPVPEYSIFEKIYAANSEQKSHL